MHGSFDSTEADFGILDRIESEEMPLLAWGIVDGGFEEHELLDRLDGFANDTSDARGAEAILDSLRERALVVRLEMPDGAVLRSRMAETVRLLVRLKQLFARHLETGTWPTAPNLVSDFRFIARPRSFPRRDIGAEEFLSAVQKIWSAEAKLERALRALTSSEGNDFRFAPFQVRAATSILQAVNRSEPSGTLIAAGTGSGKTKAVYLPALAEVARLSDGQAWTKLIAVYPRNELLKDQLQTALAELRSLRARADMQLTIGAYYGDTPLSERESDLRWPRRGAGHVCPFLQCPVCAGDLLWFSYRGQGALECSRCDERVLPDELMVSRFQMQKTPPDVLLTTTETLNRQMSSDYSRHVFGIGLPRPHRPRFLLLDEIHTHSGLTGAQTAILLRRWRHGVGTHVHTIGLSATILDGENFLAQLAGIPSANVSVIQPTDQELIEEGKEYLVALRGDPASGTALLSTSIQSAMLLRRILDTDSKGVSGGAFGSKLFMFTDDLDVTNRLLHFMRNAEGQDDRGQPDTRGLPKGSLANLRGKFEIDHQERLRDGQGWELCHEIGHQLTPAEMLEIGRTSSQDPGLQRSADIIVATASLEVGLDDDTVGAILQHKAPRDAAQFIQRRGRAGRTRLMRPWTTVVLSDYGRDRLAFQAWDALFDPQLRPARLPVTNRYVLRIQATYALLDWLAMRLRREGAKRGYIWQEVGGPDPRYRDRRRKVERELIDLLERPERREEFRKFVGAALSLPAEEVDALLWDPPRAILATVAPTMLRRIESGWLRSARGGREDLYADTPLPDFLPSALFQDLLLPEVEIERPPSGHHQPDPERMGVQQALREFAPGRVTHRFAVGHTLDRLWIPPGDLEGDSELLIDDYIAADPLGDIRFEEDPQEIVRVQRPWRLRPVNPENRIANSSNARLIWRTNIAETGNSVDRTPPDSGGWSSVLGDLRFHLHQVGGRLGVLRAAVGSEATVTVNNETRVLTSRFVDADGRVALGFRLDADGISFTVLDPGDWSEVLDRDLTRSRSFRTDWFRERVRVHPALRSSVSIFKRDWLAELTLAAVAEEASTCGFDLEEGVRRLGEQNLGNVLDRVLTVVFQSVDPTQVTGAEAAESEVDVTKLHRELVALASETSTGAVLREGLDSMLHPAGPEFETWLRDRYLSTVTGALTHAAALLYEHASVEDLIADPGPWRDGRAIVRISENRPGGIGVIEGIYDRFQQDPRRFWRLVGAVVEPTEYEIVDAELRRIVALSITDSEVQEMLRSVRASRAQRDREGAWRNLVRVLGDRGVSTTHGVRVALAFRILRPASSAGTDELLANLLRRWDEAEEALGLELDARVFANLVSEDASLDTSLALAMPTGAADRRWRFNATLSLLWPRGSALRSRPLELWQPYRELSTPDRTLVSERLSRSTVILNIETSGDGAPDEDAAEALATYGSVGFAGHSRDPRLRQRLLRMLVEPVEAGVLELHPRIVGVRRSSEGSVVELEIPEVFG